MRAAICGSLIASLLLSPKLWLTAGRFYPQTPVFARLHPIRPPFDAIIFATMLALLLWAAIASRPAKPVVAFLTLAAAYTVFDQSRLQPWFYQYCLMLGATLTTRRRAACRFIVASVYFWSGLHKVNSTFVDETFRWMLEPFFTTLPAWLHAVAIAFPIGEMAIGLALLTRRFRKHAIVGAIAMHAFILLCIGPLGHNWDAVVWPWNLAMIAFDVLLFWPEPDPLAPTPAPILVLAGLLPLLSFFGLYDRYLSFALYAGSDKATIYIADALAGRLPEGVEAIMDVNDSGIDELSIFEWSFDELGVPPYAEARVFRNIGRRVCSMAGNPREMALVIRTKGTWIHRPRLFTYDCATLWSN